MELQFLAIAKPHIVTTCCQQQSLILTKNSLIYVKFQINVKAMPIADPGLSGNVNYNSVGSYNYSNVFLPVGSGLSFGVVQDIQIDLQTTTSSD